ncbi:hypothetical protein B0I00_2786 [Novosphingobium kunmingense]|uniref:Hpr(Ser) kinase/phosphatase n=1 Tax=Novosphingobium kunmingense TaxID=1211806 RepID=A0A2N0H5E1_9SPHN|nr:hypothetical protein [Novosphingobium kunmingense]PKB14155.1 hypothetical protein B0I00_2786 [Novosphingobium kunmingense]
MAEGRHNPRDSMALLQRETALREGEWRGALGETTLSPGQQRMDGDEFLVLARAGFSLHYRKGEGVTLGGYRPEYAQELALQSVGSLYAAIACINGLLPIHASAVAASGRVIAFTAPSGGGKSTLVTGLGDLGLPLFCDDTLVLDLADPALIHALPGHKRVKLWPEAMALTGRAPVDLVLPDYPKYYASPAAGDVTQPLSLGALVYLEEGPQPALRRLAAGEAMAAFADDHYTRDLYDAANPHTRAERFALHARIARQVPAYMFTRPLAGSRFGETCAFLAERIAAMVKP